jgi:Fur family ferric uptake transcriptional regulator
MTRQREVILEELEKSRAHPTADELYVRVRKRLPRISLGTVYRNLEMLCEAGLIRKLEMAGTQRRFDRCCDRHDHVRCIRCGRIEDVPAGLAAATLSRVQQESDYEIVDHRLEFQGLCPRCRVRKVKRDKK